MNSAIFSCAFQTACTDYLFLLNRGYPGRGALDLVADHYRLNRSQRVVLYRGVFSDSESADRRKRITTCYTGEALAVDLLNVLFTISNYLYGRTVFLATDGLLKDNGECFAKPQPGDTLLKAISLLASYLTDLHPLPGEIQCYIDEDFDHCSYIKTEWEKRLNAPELNYITEAVKSPDRILKTTAAGLIATADSAIVDNALCPVLDLAHQVICRNFQTPVTDIKSFIGI